MKSLTLTYTTNKEVCTENWTCLEWIPEPCPENQTQVRTCTDLNSCGTATSKPNETQTCIYVFESYNLSNGTGIISVLSNKSTIISSSDLNLELATTENITNAAINITKYSNTTLPLNLSATPLNKYQEINAESTLKQKIDWAVIKIYYTDEELTAKNLNEDTLKIYFFNESTQTWAELNSAVNKSWKYVWANISHLSTYGIFGEEFLKD